MIRITPQLASDLEAHFSMKFLLVATLLVYHATLAADVFTAVAADNIEMLKQMLDSAASSARNKLMWT